MDTVQDFEDLLELLGRFEIRYLIIGGLAFIYPAKPRYTKDMDLWVGPDPENVLRANRALAAFGSPHLLESGRLDEVLQPPAPGRRLRCSGWCGSDDGTRISLTGRAALQLGSECRCGSANGTGRRGVICRSGTAPFVAIT